jgi:hypothetical protein
MIRATRRVAVGATTILVCALASACSSRGDAPASATDRPRDEDEIDGIPVFWRVAVDVRGEGNVHMFLDGGIDCTGGPVAVHGACGPSAIISNQRQPATLQEIPASGWTFTQWQVQIREPDGTSAPRTVPDPASPLYLDSFGANDTGQTEVVTAVFIKQLDSGAPALAEAGAAPDARPGLPPKP